MALDGIVNVKGLAPAVPDARGAAPSPKTSAGATIGHGGGDSAAPAPPDLRQVVENLTQKLRDSQSDLSFSVDESTGKTIVRVVRSSTGELVRQIPSEEAIAIAASLAQGGQPITLGLDRWS